jgi:hypothetical protein
MNLRTQLIATVFLFSLAAGLFVGFLVNYRLLSYLFPVTGLPHDLTIATVLFLVTILPLLVFACLGRKIDFTSKFVSTNLSLILSCFSACFIGILATSFLSRYLGYEVFSNITGTVIIPDFLGATFFSAWEFLIAFAGLAIGSSMRKTPDAPTKQATSGKQNAPQT